MGYTLLEALLKASDADKVEPSVTPRITRYIATTQSAADSERLRTLVAREDAHILIDDSDHNLQAINQAATIILASRSTDLYDFLLAKGVPQALAGKLVITIDPSVTTEDVVDMIKLNVQNNIPSPFRVPTVVRAVPNLAVKVGHGVTIVEQQDRAPLSREQADMVAWIFGRVGEVFSLSGDAFRSGVMLVTGGLGMMSVFTDWIFNCPLAHGLNKTQRRRLARMVLDGLESNIDHGLDLENLRAFSNPWLNNPVSEALAALDRGRTKPTITEAIGFGLARIAHDYDDDKRLPFDPNYDVRPGNRRWYQAS